jgi:hypothetical protein
MEILPSLQLAAKIPAAAEILVSQKLECKRSAALVCRVPRHKTRAFAGKMRFTRRADDSIAVSAA